MFNFWKNKETTPVDNNNNKSITLELLEPTQPSSYDPGNNANNTVASPTPVGSSPQTTATEGNTTVAPFSVSGEGKAGGVVSPVVLDDLIPPFLSSSTTSSSSSSGGSFRPFPTSALSSAVPSAQSSQQQHEEFFTPYSTTATVGGGSRTSPRLRGRSPTAIASAIVLQQLVAMDSDDEGEYKGGKPPMSPPGCRPMKEEVKRVRDDDEEVGPRRPFFSFQEDISIVQERRQQPIHFAATAGGGGGASPPTHPFPLPSADALAHPMHNQPTSHPPHSPAATALDQQTQHHHHPTQLVAPREQEAVMGTVVVGGGAGGGATILHGDIRGSHYVHSRRGGGGGGHGIPRATPAAPTMPAAANNTTTGTPPLPPPPPPLQQQQLGLVLLKKAKRMSCSAMKNDKVHLGAVVLLLTSISQYYSYSMDLSGPWPLLLYTLVFMTALLFFNVLDWVVRTWQNLREKNAYEAVRVLSFLLKAVLVSLWWWSFKMVITVIGVWRKVPARELVAAERTTSGAPVVPPASERHSATPSTAADNGGILNQKKEVSVKLTTDAHHHRLGTTSGRALDHTTTQSPEPSNPTAPSDQSFLRRGGQWIIAEGGQWIRACSPKTERSVASLPADCTKKAENSQVEMVPPTTAVTTVHNEKRKKKNTKESSKVVVGSTIATTATTTSSAVPIEKEKKNKMVASHGTLGVMSASSANTTAGLTEKRNTKTMKEEGVAVGDTREAFLSSSTSSPSPKKNTLGRPLNGASRARSRGELEADRLASSLFHNEAVIK